MVNTINSNTKIQKAWENYVAVRRTTAWKAHSLRKLGRAVHEYEHPLPSPLQKLNTGETDCNCSALYLLNSCSTPRTWDHGCNIQKCNSPKSSCCDVNIWEVVLNSVQNLKYPHRTWNKAVSQINCI